MEKYYSKVQPDLLLHIVFRFEDFTRDRIDIIEPDNFLQCAALRFNTGRTFRPHKHIERCVTDEHRKAQESWFVVRGLIRCTFYDIDDTIIAQPYIKEGEASFTLHGGHTYTVLEDHTCLLEYKSGKYEGQENDKEFIDDVS
jgi:hypothetical protein